MPWIRAAMEQPQLPSSYVIGVVIDERGHRSLHILQWEGRDWLYAYNNNSVARYGQHVSHWMPVPALPTRADE